MFVFIVSWTIYKYPARGRSNFKTNKKIKVVKALSRSLPVDTYMCYPVSGIAHNVTDISYTLDRVGMSVPILLARKINNFY